MANQLWSDLLIGSGQQLWSDLDSAPGIVTPAPAVLSLLGQVPGAAQPTAVFRTPAPAALTLFGQQAGSPVILSPAPAAISAAGQVPARQLIRTITPALAAPIESPLADPVPTLITIWTTQPGVAQVTLQSLELNVTQGGNIGFVTPQPANLSISTLQYSLLLLAGGAGVGQLIVQGLVPTLNRELVVTPEVGRIQSSGQVPELSLPFTWIDDDPAPARTWITDAAA